MRKEKKTGLYATMASVIAVLVAMSIGGCSAPADQSQGAADETQTAAGKVTATANAGRAIGNDINTIEDMGQWEALPLSYRDQLEQIIPHAVADRLLEDINNALKPSGMKIATEVDVDVSTDVTEEGKTVAFDVRAYPEDGQVDLRCVYNTDGTPVSIDIVK